MKKGFISILALIFSLTALGADDEQADAALVWLGLIDAGEYEASWNLAASLFQQQLSSSQWSQALTRARSPFGELRSRVINTTTQADSLPGAPDGEYVVLTFTSAFDHKSSATETLTLMKENDSWRPVGYFIK